MLLLSFFLLKINKRKNLANYTCFKSILNYFLPFCLNYSIKKRTVPITILSNYFHYFLNKNIIPCNCSLVMPNSLHFRAIASACSCLLLFCN